MKHFELACLFFFYLQTSIAELMEKMLSCEVHFVRCGFYHVAQTKRNAMKRYDDAFTERFFSGRAAVIQTTLNWPRQEPVVMARGLRKNVNKCESYL